MYDLDELELLEKAATPAPWEKSDTDQLSPFLWSKGKAIIKVKSPNYDEEGWFDFKEEDLSLMVAIRNAAPELIADLRKLTAEVERLRADAEREPDNDTDALCLKCSCELEKDNARLREAIATLCVSEYLAPHLVYIARRALAGKGEAT